MKYGPLYGLFERSWHKVVVGEPVAGLHEYCHWLIKVLRYFYFSLANKSTIVLLFFFFRALMAWAQLDWLSVWSFSTSLANPGVWECGSLIASPALGLMAILTGGMEVDFLLQNSERSTLELKLKNWSPLKTCVTSFFFDNFLNIFFLSSFQNNFFNSNKQYSFNFFELNTFILDANSFFWSYIWAGEIIGTKILNSVSVTNTWLNLFISLDIGILCAELFMLSLIIFVAPRFGSYRVKKRNGYDDFITFCQNNNISLTEFGAITTLALGLVGFDFFLAFTEEDPTEIFSFLILALAIMGGLGLILALDIQYFYMISALGNGNAVVVAFNDLIANTLCILRIFLCWTRYIFYDFQVEALDWTFHYVDGFGEYGLGFLGFFSRVLPNITCSTSPSIWDSVWLPLFWIFSITLDLWVFAFQVLVAIFKYSIALFLMWLLFDLFWFRPLADSETKVLSSIKK